MYPAKIFARPADSVLAHRAINKAFCGSAWKRCKHGEEGYKIVQCETGYTYSIYAGVKKHQYWGIFQMGYSERQRFGFAFSPWAQATAAKKYFNLSGWTPWECAYRMGIL